MFVESENSELLELLSQVRAAAAEEDSAAAAAEQERVAAAAADDLARHRAGLAPHAEQSPFGLNSQSAAAAPPSLHSATTSPFYINATPTSSSTTPAAGLVMDGCSGLSPYYPSGAASAPTHGLPFFSTAAVKPAPDVLGGNTANAGREPPVFGTPVEILGGARGPKKRWGYTESQQSMRPASAGHNGLQERDGAPCSTPPTVTKWVGSGVSPMHAGPTTPQRPPLATQDSSRYTAPLFATTAPAHHAPRGASADELMQLLALPSPPRPATTGGDAQRAMYSLSPGQTPPSHALRIPPPLALRPQSAVSQQQQQQQPPSSVMLSSIARLTEQHGQRSERHRGVSAAATVGDGGSPLTPPGAQLRQPTVRTTPATTRNSPALSRYSIPSTALGSGRYGGAPRQLHGRPDAASQLHSPSTTPVLLMLMEDDGVDGGDASRGVLAHRILTFSRDQQGCRVLQAVLDREASRARGGGRWEDADAEAQFAASVPITRIIAALRPQLADVMSDAYGNFLIQKLFEVAPIATRRSLLLEPSLFNHLCDVARSPHGTFAVQRMIETLRNEEEERIVFDALRRDLRALLTDVNGGHALYKAMHYMKQRYLQHEGGRRSESDGRADSPITAAQRTAPLREKIRFLYFGLLDDLAFICQHKQGCCIAQKCVDFFSQVFSTTGPHDAPVVDPATTDNFFLGLISGLLPHVLTLAIHPYGNYVVTHVVEVCYAKGSIYLVDTMAERMQAHLMQLCTNKFASNVVEHVLRHCNESRIRAICRTLTTPCAEEGSPRTPLIEAVMDPYGNYVVQTLLTVAPVDELMPPGSQESFGMLQQLQACLPALSERNFGKKISTKMELAMLRVAQQRQ